MTILLLIWTVLYHLRNIVSAAATGFFWVGSMRNIFSAAATGFFLGGFNMELMCISLIANISSSLLHVHSFH